MTELRSLVAVAALASLAACAITPKYVAPEGGDVAEVRIAVGGLPNAGPQVPGSTDLFAYLVADAKCRAPQELGFVGTAPLTFARRSSLGMPLNDHPAKAATEIRLAAGEQRLVLRSSADLAGEDHFCSFLIEGAPQAGARYEIVLNRPELTVCRIDVFEIAADGDGGFSKTRSDAFTVANFPRRCRRAF